jgi:hypothetical protein
MQGRCDNDCKQYFGLNPLGRPRHKREEHIKMHVNRLKWFRIPAPASMALKLWVP